MRSKKARKDNPVAKEGESYLKVRKGIRGYDQFFKNYKDLDKKYPNIPFKNRHKHYIDLLEKYKKLIIDGHKISPERFLKDQGWT